MMSAKAALLLLSLALALPASAELACPAGQYPVCLGACFCSPFDPGETLQEVQRMASTSLAIALKRAEMISATRLPTSDRRPPKSKSEYKKETFPTGLSEPSPTDTHITS